MHIKEFDNIYFNSRMFPSSNTTLIKGEMVILVDPGYKPSGDTGCYRNLFRKAGITLYDIDEIWFTHNHPDHTQMAYHLLQKKDMKIVCHPGAKRVVESENPLNELIEKEKKTMIPLIEYLYPGRRGKVRFFERLLTTMINLYGRPLSMNMHPIEVTDTFRDGEKRYGIDIMYLPGHTSDEVGFFINNILVMGDLIATFNFTRPAVMNVPSSDIDGAVNSLENIIDVEPDWILPGHGAATRIDRNVVNGIYEETLRLRDYGMYLIDKYHSFFPFFFNVQRRLPLTVRLQERLAVIPVLYKSYLNTLSQDSKSSPAAT